MGLSFVYDLAIVVYGPAVDVDVVAVAHHVCGIAAPQDVLGQIGESPPAGSRYEPELIVLIEEVD